MLKLRNIFLWLFVTQLQAAELSKIEELSSQIVQSKSENEFKQIDQRINDLKVFADSELQKLEQRERILDESVAFCEDRLDRLKSGEELREVVQKCICFPENYFYRTDLNFSPLVKRDLADFLMIRKVLQEKQHIGDSKKRWKSLLVQAQIKAKNDLLNSEEFTTSFDTKKYSIIARLQFLKKERKQIELGQIEKQTFIRNLSTLTDQLKQREVIHEGVLDKFSLFVDRAVASNAKKTLARQLEEQRVQEEEKQKIKQDQQRQRQLKAEQKSKLEEQLRRDKEIVEEKNKKAKQDQESLRLERKASIQSELQKKIEQEKQREEERAEKQRKKEKEAQQKKEAEQKLAQRKQQEENDLIEAMRLQVLQEAQTSFKKEVHQTAVSTKKQQNNKLTKVEDDWLSGSVTQPVRLISSVLSLVPAGSESYTLSESDVRDLNKKIKQLKKDYRNSKNSFVHASDADHEFFSTSDSNPIKVIYALDNLLNESDLTDYFFLLRNITNKIKTSSVSLSKNNHHINEYYQAQGDLIERMKIKLQESQGICGQISSLIELKSLRDAAGYEVLHLESQLETLRNSHGKKDKKQIASLNLAINEKTKKCHEYDNYALLIGIRDLLQQLVRTTLPDVNVASDFSPEKFDEIQNSVNSFISNLLVDKGFMEHSDIKNLLLQCVNGCCDNNFQVSDSANVFFEHVIQGLSRTTPQTSQDVFVDMMTTPGCISVEQSLFYANISRVIICIVDALKKSQVTIQKSSTEEKSEIELSETKS